MQNVFGVQHQEHNLPSINCIFHLSWLLVAALDLTVKNCLPFSLIHKTPCIIFTECKVFCEWRRGTLSFISLCFLEKF